MAILTLDLTLGLSADVTRTLLGRYSRGCKTNNVTYMPKIEFDGGEEKYFNCNDSDTFIFMSDYFGTEPSFDVTIIKNDDTVIPFSKCNVFIIECADIKSIKITNLGAEVRRAHVIH